LFGFPESSAEGVGVALAALLIFWVRLFVYRSIVYHLNESLSDSLELSYTFYQIGNLKLKRAANFQFEEIIC
jgi:hypothetical protein